MDAPIETTVVWADSGPSSESAESALTRWARTRGVRLVAPSASSGLRAGGPLAIDLSESARVESLLARARIALLRADAESVDSELALASTVLRAHPEWPHAAWLRAEIDRTWAARYVRLVPANPARATSLLAEADGLDGGRVAALGDATAVGASSDVPTVETSIVFSDDARFSLRIDGRAARGGQTRLSEGEHHVQVTRDGDLVWAGWVGVFQGAVLSLPAPLPQACSSGDLAHRASARCDSWIVVAHSRSQSTNALTLTECHRSVCREPVRIDLATNTPSTERASETRVWPAWATWALVGVGAAAITTVALTAGGAFDPQSRETRFVNGGVRTSGTPIFWFR